MPMVNLLEAIVFKAFQLFKHLHLDRLFLLGIRSYPFLDYFKGFENVEVVRRIFGEKTEVVLGNLRVEFSSVGGYMGVNPFNGHLMINPHYLSSGDKLDIYLDLVHELVHIRQRMDGAELFDPSYGYVERPTEIEAYHYAVEEARRLGMSDERICEYLKTEWMSDLDLRQLAKVLHVKC
jgi:hypothetical protein